MLKFETPIRLGTFSEPLYRLKRRPYRSFNHSLATIILEHIVVNIVSNLSLVKILLIKLIIDGFFYVWRFSSFSSFLVDMENLVSDSTYRPITWTQKSTYTWQRIAND